jgi:elongation factor G
MKTYQTDQIKNIALLGNSGSGKTTLAEAMLFNGGVIERRGTIEGRNTVSDYRPIEHENGNSIFSTVLYTEFKNKKINILEWRCNFISLCCRFCCNDNQCSEWC